MKHLSSSILCVVAGLCMPASATAQKTHAPSQRPTACDKPGAVNSICFDKNHNGRLDPGAEAEAFAKHTEIPGFGMIDTNHDGELTPQEIDAYRKLVDEKTSPANSQTIHAIDTAHQTDPNLLANDRIDRKYGTKPLAGAKQEKSRKDAGSWSTRILLRNKFSDMSIKSRTDRSISEPSGPVTKAAGAMLSFTRNARAGTNSWLAQGSAAVQFYHARPTCIGDEPRTRGCLDNIAPNTTYWNALSIAPTITFHRLADTDDTKKDISILGFSAIGEVELFGDRPNMQYLRIAPGYTTDFDFDAEIAHLTLQWEPIDFALALGTLTQLNSGALGEFMWQLIAHTEFGKVFDAAGNADLKSDSAFARLGGSVGALYRFPEPLNRLSLNADFKYLFGAAGNPDHSHLFKAGASLSLDDKDQFTLNATYTRGDAPITDTDMELLAISLGLKL